MSLIPQRLTWHRLIGGAAPSPAGLIVIGHMFLATTCLATVMASRALAQPPALVVNGDSITDDDIEQRMKLIALANNKSPSRKEVIGELIDDKLKIQDARRYKIDITDKDVDLQYAQMAKLMHLTADQLTQTLGTLGIDERTPRAKILADLSWQSVVRGQFGPETKASQPNVSKADPDVEYIYTLQPVLFKVPPDTPVVLEARKKEAEALRARFTECNSGLAAARKQRDVVIDAPISKNSSELAYALRQILANTTLGHLTPLETTSEGVQLFAVCARKENLNRPKSEAYLRGLRLRADISNVRDDVRDDISKDKFQARPPAKAQLDEAVALDKKVGELRQAGKFSEAVPLARRVLEICESACPNHDYVALPLNTLAELYERLGRYADAEPLYTRALAILEKAFGPEHPAVAQSLNNLAGLYEDQGRYADAEPLYTRALAIREKVLGADHPEVAGSLNNLALLYKDQGRYADAEPLYVRALAIREKALGPEHPDVAQSLYNLGSLHFSQNRYADAEPLLKRALAIREKALGPDHVDVALAVGGLALLYQAQARFADAEPLYKRALAIYEKALGPNHRTVAQVLSDLGTLYSAESRFAAAEPAYARALAIREAALGPDNPDVAETLDHVALLYQKQGRYVDAEQRYRQALAINEKALGRDHPAVARSLDNLAALYKAQGRYADAEPLSKRSLATYEKALGTDRPEFARSLDNLGDLYRAQGRYAEAEPLYKRALVIFEKALGPHHPDVARLLNNLGDLYRAQGRYAEAEPLYRRTQAIDEQVLGPDHLNVVQPLNGLASLYRAQGRDTDAEPLYKRGLQISEKALGPDHPEVTKWLNNLALLYKHQSRYADALPLVQRTIGQARGTPSVALPVLFAAQGNGLISADEAQDDALNVVQRAVLSATAAAVNKLAPQLATGTDGLAGPVRNDQDLAAEAKALNQAILAAASSEPAKRDAPTEQRIRDRLAEIAKERAALQSVFTAEFPDYAALSNPPPLTVKEVQGLLSEGEALLLFATGDEESYVFAVTRQSAMWKPIPLGTAALSSKIAAFRRGLDIEVPVQWAKGGKPALFDLALANELYVTLLGPVEELTKDARHLLVVPAGPLTSLPFHLLVTEKPRNAIPQVKDIGAYRDAAWLIKRQAVSVLPALANLKSLRQAARRDAGVKPMVGFGDPLFDPAERTKALAGRRGGARVAVTRGYGEFWQGASVDRSKLAQYLPSLPDTADELKAVARKLGAAAGDVHLGSDASEATVKRTALADYRVVYFATHGLVAGNVEEFGEPSLALTLPKQPSEVDDGLLTASEVAQLKLNADWVVLSACNTAAADKPGAEALSALARAFFYAGAQALLVSHWPVDSEPATRLTTSTFAAMKEDPKLGRAEALRNAMLAYMNDKKSNLWNAYPAFWGPFSLIGEGAAR